MLAFESFLTSDCVIQTILTSVRVGSSVHTKRRRPTDLSTEPNTKRRRAKEGSPHDFNRSGVVASIALFSISLGIRHLIQQEFRRPRALGELDPSDAHNTLITDIQIAPRSASDVLK